MKRLLALLLACLLLVLNACGTPTEDAANTEPSELTAEELPESCRRWFDIAASSGTAHFSSSAWVAASAPPRAPKYRAACARSMPSGFSSRSGILGPMLICPPSFTRIKNRLSIQHRGPAVNDFKISNFFAINLLTIWVNRDIIQTTNPPA